MIVEMGDEDSLEARSCLIVANMMATVYNLVGRWTLS